MASTGNYERYQRFLKALQAAYPEKKGDVVKKLCDEEWKDKLKGNSDAFESRMRELAIKAEKRKVSCMQFFAKAATPKTRYAFAFVLFTHRSLSERLQCPKL